MNLAMKAVTGTGKRVVAVFEDPNCGYCKTMRRDLLKLENATVYTFVLPILAADSETKAKKVLVFGRQDEVLERTDAERQGA